MSNSLELFAFADTCDLARAVGARLDVELRPIHIHRFPDGESLVRAESLGSPRAIIFRSLDHPNEKLIEVLQAADALRRQGVEELGLVAPYLGYMRQDRIFRPGEPISQQVVARLLDASFDHVLTVEAHLHRIRSLSEVYSCSARSVSAAAPIANWMRDQECSGVVIGPDSESEPWIRSIAGQAGLEWIVCAKTRHADRDVRIDLPALPKGSRTAWIIDDIASSGGTLEVLARLLRERGVEKIGAIVVHALLDDEAPSRLARAGVGPLLSTDSIVHSTNRISLAALLAQEISMTNWRAETS